MKRIVSFILAVLMLTAVGLTLTACGDEGKLSVNEVKIISQNVTTQVGTVASSRHHQISTECKVHEDIPTVKVKYIFSNGGKSYYYEKESTDLHDGSTHSFIEYLSMPVYADQVFQNTDPAGEPLTLKVGSDQDILDALGKGAVVTVEIYENGQKLAEGSATYE